MTSQAKPVCPHCGSALMPRSGGDLVCAQHGQHFPSEVIARTLGDEKLQKFRGMAEGGQILSRRCPEDRLTLMGFTNASGSVRFEACGRCGSAWFSKDELDRIAARTPAPAGVSPSEARSILGLAAINSAVATTLVRTR